VEIQRKPRKFDLGHLQRPPLAEVGFYEQGSFRSAERRGGPKRLSDFPSDFVKRGCALLGIVAASAKRETLYLVGSSDLSLHGVKAR
jgi:hypothetical protein